MESLKFILDLHKLTHTEIKQGPPENMFYLVADGKTLVEHCNLPASNFKSFNGFQRPHTCDPHRVTQRMTMRVLEASLDLCTQQKSSCSGRKIVIQLYL